MLMTQGRESLPQVLHSLIVGGAIVYRSKTQSIIALSSTEAELLAAVEAAKVARFLRSMLKELGFRQKKPTVIYEDNQSTIHVFNSRKMLGLE